MTISEVKSVLKSYQIAKEAADCLERELETGKSPQYKSDGAVHERNSNSVELAYCELADRKRKAERLKIKVERLIALVPDQRQKDILRLKYIKGMTWEQVAYVMNYSYRHTTRIHGYALATICKRCP